MGIKGIYSEIGRGQRIQLSTLAARTFRQTGKPLRVAVDISIWSFQVQSGRGGSNPQLRTLYYRLLRFLRLAIQPIFVFDGPNRPSFKRNRHVYTGNASVPQPLKRLLGLFGYPYHISPGEAEAECALLQNEGIVDAVFSEDVDTLMFGCGKTMRNWSSEDTRGKTPTHVSLYDAAEIREGKSGLDREGMILVAMISGGDYIPTGIPGLGIKAACEAARAGFGKSLCALASSDVAGIAAWRESLAHELKTNESGFFGMKRKALTIPESFPDTKVLRYYTHPAVSSADEIQRLKERLDWDTPVDVPGLRSFVAENFQWSRKSGARKFVRNLAPALLVHRLQTRSRHYESGRYTTETVGIGAADSALVSAVCGRRQIATADESHEIRVSYVPLDIAKIDLNAEASDSESEVEVDDGEDDLGIPESELEPLPAPESIQTVQKSRIKRSRFDPSAADRAWLPQIYVERGVPTIFQAWEVVANKPAPSKRRPGGRRRVAKLPANQTTMDRFVRVTKAVPETSEGSVVTSKQSASTVAADALCTEVAGEPEWPRANHAHSTPTPSSRVRAGGAMEKKTIIALRESLEGAWKALDTSPVGIASKHWKGIDTIDLTNA
ncbi:MAG: hypothetical protein M1825_005856 [Sarcosagium campestre]|nr:MAG: hypothetical protein M1825_005856 [Sarcosagium campestre]